MKYKKKKKNGMYRRIKSVNYVSSYSGKTFNLFLEYLMFQQFLDVFSYV